MYEFLSFETRVSDAITREYNNKISNNSNDNSTKTMELLEEFYKDDKNQEINFNNIITVLNDFISSGEAKIINAAMSFLLRLITYKKLSNVRVIKNIIEYVASLFDDEKTLLLLMIPVF